MTLLGTTYNGGELRDAVNGLSYGGGFLPIGSLMPIRADIQAALDALPVDLQLQCNTVTRRGRLGASRNAIIDAFTTARSAPAITLYVDVLNGSDAANGLSWATAVKSAYVAEGLAGSQAATINFLQSASAPQAMTRASGFTGPSGSATVIPQGDRVYVAWGGVIEAWIGDALTWTEDATYKGMYTATVASISTVVDVANIDQSSSLPQAMPILPSAEACRYQPGVYHTGSTLTLRRSDGLAPTTANTRVLRPSPTFISTGDVSLAFISGDNYSGWKFMGGANGTPTTAAAYGGIRYNRTGNGSLPASKKLLYVENAVISQSFRGFDLDGPYGLALLVSCRVGNCISDAYNIHNVLGNLSLTVLLNCRGDGAGIYPSLSNQIVTLHDGPNCMAISIGGRYRGSAGGVVRNIGGSRFQSWCDNYSDDRGDIQWGGVIPPTGVRVDADTQASLYWPIIERCDIDIYAGLNGSVDVISPLTYKSGGPGTVTVSAS